MLFRCLFILEVTILASVVAPGCQPKPIPPAPPPVDGIPACAAGVVPQQDGLCDGLFAQVGEQAYQCYSCGVQQGCLAVPEQVYCVSACLVQDGTCQMLAADDPPPGVKRAKKAPRRVPARVGGR